MSNTPPSESALATTPSHHDYHDPQGSSEYYRNSNHPKHHRAQSPSSPNHSNVRWHHTLPSTHSHAHSNARILSVHHPSSRQEFGALPTLLKPHLHPTHAIIEISAPHPSRTLAGGSSSGDITSTSPTGETTRRQVRWESRKHRKGRYVPARSRSGLAPPPSPRLRSHGVDGEKQGIANSRSVPGKEEGGGAISSYLRRTRHVLRIQWWNISWWVAFFFTLGSIIWVINGFAAFLPFSLPSLFPSDQPISQKMKILAEWTAWVGATVFEVGSVCGLLEAWNRGREVVVPHFVDLDLESGHGLRHGKLGEDDSELHHARAQTGEHSKAKAAGSDPYRQYERRRRHSKQEWIWFSPDPKFFREAGFLAAFFQFWAATIFWISGFTALPQIQSSISPTQRLFNGVYWVPQVIGGSGFIISSTFIMLEAQKKWYTPRPKDIGWQVGLWNLIGGIGFTLSGIFGFYISQSDPEGWAAYESALTTFWGGWAFLIGSVLQGVEIEV